MLKLDALTAEAEEVLATKAYTIGRRGSFKDYVDVFFGFKLGITNLAQIIDLANEKYGNLFNDWLFLEQLLYLDDLEEEPLIMLGGNQTPSKQEIRNLFEQKISEYKL